MAVEFGSARLPRRSAPPRSLPSLSGESPTGHQAGSRIHSTAASNVGIHLEGSRGCLRYPRMKRASLGCRGRAAGWKHYAQVLRVGLLRSSRSRAVNGRHDCDRDLPTPMSTYPPTSPASTSLRDPPVPGGSPWMASQAARMTRMCAVGAAPRQRSDMYQPFSSLPHHDRTDVLCLDAGRDVRHLGWRFLHDAGMQHPPSERSREPRACARSM